MTPPKRLVVLAPNWLGDAVMALPLIADVRRAWAETVIAVAARPSVAPLFALVRGVNETVVLDDASAWRAASRTSSSVQRLAAGDFDAALLLPNSFQSAALVWRAGSGDDTAASAECNAWTAMMMRSRGGRNLVELGMAGDVIWAGRVDRHTKVPSLDAERGLL